MTKLHSRNQKPFLEFVNFFILNYIYVNKSFLKFNGFYLSVKGKLGTSGNAKKKFFFIKAGNIGLSNNFSKIEYKQGVIKTDNGSIGITTILSF